MGAVSIVFYVLMTRISTSVLTDTVASVGLLIAFYYGLTAFACTWFYRNTLTKSWSHFVNRCALPLAGGLMLGGLFVYGLVYYADPSHSDGDGVSFFGHRIGAVSFIGLVALVLGVVLMTAYRHARPAFFRGETLPKAVAPVLDRAASSPIDAAVVPQSEGAGGGHSSS